MLVEATTAHRVKNYIDGKWVDSSDPDAELRPVENPATGEVIGAVSRGNARDIDAAAQAAARAFPEWRSTPPVKRVQHLFKLKYLLEENLDEIARICTTECGKTLRESQEEVVRAIENVEGACGIPMLMQGEFSEDIARGLDEYMIRQPLGVGACVAPFNFPAMVPFWFLPWALACGNTYIVKNSDKVPLTMVKIFELIEESGFPPGVVNKVSGGKPAVDAILDHPAIAAVSFVGSTKVGRYLYQRGCAAGKRVQAQAGAKNPIVIMPDADIEAGVRTVANSVYGCAGQRCLAAANVIIVGDNPEFREALVAASEEIVTGNGLDPDVTMGAVIDRPAKEFIESCIQKAIDEDAKPLLDGRGAVVEGCENGYFVKPTVLDGVDPGGEIFHTEIFGPVMSITTARDFDHAIELCNSGEYGNAANIFTQSGRAAQRFRHDAMGGNIGINIGVPAPMAFFPFSGWKQSFFGDLHGQGRHAVEFYTQTKVVVERWVRELERRF